MRYGFALRQHFELGNFATTISRRTFEANFTKTKEKVVFTFNGWDGKSYNGESRRASVYRTNIEGFENIRFVKVGKGLHYIVEAKTVVEKATGESHPAASWLVDVERS
ncbi:MAG: hypothetical protein SPL86_00115 [Succiniclasticum sp.]|uniref:hypothetical protein n=1 Tax=Succiniclasticum sp. TaxID=2775030 RepID=UPI001B012016|nr:hypothetical protein [Succiniclasticum sp.]MBO6182680.1 hypothetical protein [Acidaminococcaceae bacterium]MDY6289870.1 hypothetical protein [Succiniclasticum sp.]